MNVAPKASRFLLGVLLAAAAAGTLCAQTATKLVALTASDSMKFSVTGFAVRPGEVVHVKLLNLPKSTMGHNWVLLRMGIDAGAYCTEAAAAMNEDFLPKALSDEVVASIGLLRPNQVGETIFTAPLVPGDYVYVCSVPAHFWVGMRGVMTVRQK